MIVTWMAYAIAVSAFVALAAHAMDRAARALQRPTRFIWLVAIVATVMLPIVGSLVNNAAQGAVVGGGVTADATGTALAAAVSARTPLSRVLDSARSLAPRIDRLLIMGWAALTLILLLRIGYATLVLWRRRRHWVAREIDGVALFVTPDLGPAVVALPESQILVPQWLLDLEATQLSMVLCHEREHRVAGDPRLLVAASVLASLFPWNAAIWWQLRRLRLAVEIDCDARVLRLDPRVDRYGALLLAIAQHPRVSLHAAATLTESTSDLEQRIDAMTSSPPAAPRFAAAAFAAVGVAAIIGACAMPAPDVVTGPPTRESIVVTPTVTEKNQPLFESQVEVPARPSPDNVAPEFPAQLRASNIGGVVVSKFVVDTSGEPDMGTFVIVKSDHDLFTNAVRNALPKMRFTPAAVGRRKVKQLIQMPFVFSVSGLERTALTSVFARKKTSPEAATRTKPTASSVTSPSREATTKPPFASATASSDTIPAELFPDNMPPVYPKQLRAANVQGQVVVSFVVRSDGKPDVTTLEIHRSDHDLFANAVRNAVPSLRFKAATVNGRAIDWRVRMPFVFSLSK